MVEILNKELAKHALLETGLSPEDARVAIYAVRDIQGDGEPSRGRLVLDRFLAGGPCGDAK